jgi:hypothetical protein
MAENTKINSAMSDKINKNSIIKASTKQSKSLKVLTKAKSIHDNSSYQTSRSKIIIRNSPRVMPNNTSKSGWFKKNVIIKRPSITWSLYSLHKSISI